MQVEAGDGAFADFGISRAAEAVANEAGEIWFVADDHDALELGEMAEFRKRGFRRHAAGEPFQKNRAGHPGSGGECIGGLLRSDDGTAQHEIRQQIRRRKDARRVPRLLMAFLLQLAREIAARRRVFGFAVAEKEELHGGEGIFDIRDWILGKM